MEASANGFGVILSLLSLYSSNPDRPRMHYSGHAPWSSCVSEKIAFYYCMPYCIVYADRRRSVGVVGLLVTPTQHLFGAKFAYNIR